MEIDKVYTFQTWNYFFPRSDMSVCSVVNCAAARWHAAIAKAKSVTFTRCLAHARPMTGLPALTSATPASQSAAFPLRYPSGQPSGPVEAASKCKYTAGCGMQWRLRLLRSSSPSLSSMSTGAPKWREPETKKDHHPHPSPSPSSSRRGSKLCEVSGTGWETYMSTS